MFEAGSLIFRIQAVGAKVFAQELREADQAAKGAGESARQAGKKTEEFGRDVDKARPKVKDIAAEIRGMSSSAQQAAREVGVAFVAVGTAVVAASTLTVKAARDWESAWAGVRKTVDGTPEELAEVESGLRDLSKVLPASHTEIAAVAEAAGQLGVKTKDIVAFTRTMIDLGETTNLTSDEAATSLAQLMNIMQTAPEDVRRLGSAVVALGNDGASTERDIVQMAQRIAGAAKIIGLTEGETLGLANALASVGIEAEAGGSSVSRIMIDIAQAVSKGGEDLEKWADVAGMSADKFAAKWKSSPAEALAIVIEGMGRLHESGGDVFAMLDELGQTDVRVTRSLLGLANSGDLLRNALELGNRAWAENIALQEEAEKRYETAAAKLDVARNAVYDMAIELGQHLLPFVVQGAEAIAGLAGFIGDLPDGVQGALAIFGTLAGVIVLVGGVALLAVPKIVAFRAALATLAAEMPKTVAAGRNVAAFLTGPWGLALAAAALGIRVLNQYLDSLKASSDEMHASLTQTGATAEDVLGTFNRGGWTTVFSSLRTEVTEIQELLNKTDFGVTSLFDFLENKADLDRLAEIGAQLATIAKEDAPAAAKAFQTLIEATDGTDASILRLLDTMPAYKSLLIAMATEAGVYAESMSEAQKNQVLLEYAQGLGTKQTHSAADAYVRAAREVEGLERELDSLIDLLDKANGVGRDAITANADYQASLAEVNEYIQEARKRTEGYTLSLDPNTAAGSENRAMLAGLARDAWDAAQAQFELDSKTLGAADATARFRERLEESRETLIKRIEDFGVAREEAEKLADQILAIPSESEWRIIAETASAQQAIDNFVRLNNGRVIRFGTQISSPGNMTAQADGGYVAGDVRFYAAGGYENHVAQFARGGLTRVWAEPETEGEWYIPRAKSKRPRSTAILGDVANDFGFDLVPRSGGSGDGAVTLDGPVELGESTRAWFERALSRRRVEDRMGVDGGWRSY